MAEHYLCVHLHFCQMPPGPRYTDEHASFARGINLLKDRAAQECFAPNAALGNFAGASFDIGSSMNRWLDAHDPETYKRILDADQAHLEKWGMGNALAQPLHHSILPLSHSSEKVLQVRWGLMSFARRYGRAAAGMWLPEMAVDLETLQVLYDCGVRFTILSQAQVIGAPSGAGPYWVQLPSGDRLAVYVRDDHFSNELAFSIQTLGGAGRWARGALAPLWRNYGRLLLLAVDGETFGYHHPGEEHFLHWLLTYEAGAVGFQVTTLAHDLREHPPVIEIGINEDTAWDCTHGLARWSVGCDCTPGDVRWKVALRRAFDNLAERLDDCYRDYIRRHGGDPVWLLENSLRVRMGELTGPQLLSEAGILQTADSGLVNRLHKLLLAQFNRQRMHFSSALYFESPDRLETYFAIACAARAARLAAEVTGDDWLTPLRNDLAQVPANGGKSGEQIFDLVLGWARESEIT